MDLLFSDIDECTVNMDECDDNAICINTPGSRYCECQQGQQQFLCWFLCCQLQFNYIYNEGSQKLLQQLWKALFMISVYSSGFRSIGVPPWPACFNINECMEVTHNCVDPFLFVGYTGNGTFCEDIDECVTDTDNCASESTCSNSPGGFTCLCNTGFTGDGVHCTGTQSCNIFTCFNHSSITCFKHVFQPRVFIVVFVLGCDQIIYIF